MVRGSKVREPSALFRGSLLRQHGDITPRTQVHVQPGQQGEQAACVSAPGVKRRAVNAGRGPWWEPQPRAPWNTADSSFKVTGDSTPRGL